MEIEQKILHYSKWSIEFKAIHTSITQVCSFLKPIYPDIDQLKYFEYFFEKVDFEKIDSFPSKEDTLKNYNSIYYGLEEILRRDIDAIMLGYQKNISQLSTEQIRETLVKLIELIGSLKRQARGNADGISFAQRYNKFHKEMLAADNSMLPFGYLILIAQFNEVILNDLLSSYEIIIKTFKEITPLQKASTPGKQKGKAGSTTEPRKKFRMMVEEKQRKKYDKISGQFKAVFKDYRGQRVAYLFMIMFDRQLLKKSDNLKALYESFTQELGKENKSFGYEGVSKHFNKKIQSDEKYKNVEDELKNLLP